MFFNNYSDLLPFIYGGLIAYPFLFGWGLFRRDDDKHDKIGYIYIDFMNVVNSNNEHYEKNFFIMNVSIECDNIILSNDDNRYLENFENQELKMCELYDKLEQFDQFITVMGEQYDYDKIICIILSDNYDVQSKLYENKYLKTIDILDIYGHLCPQESCIDSANMYCKELFEDLKKKQSAQSKVSLDEFLLSW